ncbi:MAG: hypothetical protein AMXMBFR12_06390 [Candidatus Babeliales bacterium]
MYILILLVTFTHSIQGIISFLETSQRPNSSSIIKIAGEIHDADPSGQRSILIQSLKNYAVKTTTPLTVALEDPLAIPGLEQIQPQRGLLLGLTAQLQELNLPSHVQIKNFDTKKAANCAIHFFCQTTPKLTNSILDEISFGNLITELEQTHELYRHHSILENLNTSAKKDCTNQLAQVRNHLDLLSKALTQLQLKESDSLAHSVVTLAQKSVSLHKIYDPLYKADVGLTSLAAIVAIFESKNNMALACGERHAKDVSRIIEFEEWKILDGPHSFTSDWLLHSMGN